MSFQFLEKVKNRVYFVGGVSGTGKSTLLEVLLKTGDKFQVVSGSKCFMQWLRLKGDDYEALQLLSHDFKNKELDKMMRHLIYNPLFGNKSLLINAHYLRIIDGEVSDVVSDVVSDWISLFDGLFLIITKPEIILERLENDFLVSGRNRNIFPLNISNNNKLHLLYEYQTVTLEKVKELSRKFNIPFFVIRNHSLEEASNKLIDYLNNLEKSK